MRGDVSSAPEKGAQNAPAKVAAAHRDGNVTTVRRLLSAGLKSQRPHSDCLFDRISRMDNFDNGASLGGSFRSSVLVGDTCRFAFFLFDSSLAEEISLSRMSSNEGDNHADPEDHALLVVR
jgi:hypothetical protein